MAVQRSALATAPVQRMLIAYANLTSTISGGGDSSRCLMWFSELVDMRASLARLLLEPYFTI